MRVSIASSSVENVIFIKFIGVASYIVAYQNLEIISKLHTNVKHKCPTYPTATWKTS